MLLYCSQVSWTYSYSIFVVKKRNNHEKGIGASEKQARRQRCSQWRVLSAPVPALGDSGTPLLEMVPAYVKRRGLKVGGRGRVSSVTHVIEARAI